MIVPQKCSGHNRHKCTWWSCWPHSTCPCPPLSSPSHHVSNNTVCRSQINFPKISFKHFPDRMRSKCLPGGFSFHNCLSHFIPTFAQRSSTRAPSISETDFPRHHFLTEHVPSSCIEHPIPISTCVILHIVQRPVWLLCLYKTLMTTRTHKDFSIPSLILYPLSDSDSIYYYPTCICWLFIVFICECINMLCLSI